MKASTLEFVLQNACAEIQEMGPLGRRLAARTTPFAGATLVDGSARVFVGRDGHFSGGWICDPCLPFARNGDSLWAFSLNRQGKGYAGIPAERIAVVRRALLEAIYSGDPLATWAAGKALAQLTGIPVPDLAVA